MTLVFCRGNNALRLVKHNIFHSPVADRLAVKGHLVSFRVNLSLGFLLRHTIYLDTALFRRILDLSAASFIHFYQILIQSH